MSRNFELMTQLRLQMGVTDQPKQDATGSEGASELFSAPSGGAVHAGDAEMARFILEMFPRSGGGQKK